MGASRRRTLPRARRPTRDAAHARPASAAKATGPLGPRAYATLLALVALTLFVYAPSCAPPIPVLGRSAVHHRQPACPRRPHVARRSLGVHRLLRVELAPAHVAFAYGGCAVVRRGAWPRSSDESRDAHRDDGRALSCPAADHPCLGAERLRRRDVRRAPTARRIGCLDCRTEGRPEHALVGADGVDVRHVCAAARLESWPGGLRNVFARASGEANGRDVAVRAAPARYLAARPSIVSTRAGSAGANTSPPPRSWFARRCRCSCSPPHRAS